MNAGSTSARRAVITGATGFIGGHLCAALVTQGWEVTAIVRPTSDPARFATALPGPGAQNLHAVEHDGSTESLVEALDRAKPDVVFHLASLFLARHEAAQVEPLLTSNVLFAAQLLEAMATTGARLLVNTGTSWQFDEQGTSRAVCLYAATKQCADALADFYTDAADLTVSTLHLFDTYGPGDRRRKVVSLLIEAARSEIRLEMSPGEQLIDLVHVDDVVSAYLLAAARLLAGQAHAHEHFGVSGGRPLSIRELATIVGEIAGAPLSIAWGARAYREREVMRPWAGSAPVPGWAPTTTLDEGLRALMDLAHPKPR